MAFRSNYPICRLVASGWLNSWRRVLVLCVAAPLASEAFAANAGVLKPVPEHASVLSFKAPAQTQYLHFAIEEIVRQALASSEYIAWPMEGGAADLAVSGEILGPNGSMILRLTRERDRGPSTESLPIDLPRLKEFRGGLFANSKRPIASEAFSLADLEAFGDALHDAALARFDDSQTKLAALSAAKPQS